MKVVLYGATGQSGSRILNELMTRGHQVAAVARHTDKLPSNIPSKTDDLSDVGAIASIIAGADAVVSAYAPPADDTDQLISVTKRQIAAVKQARTPRLVVVGGAGSLEVAPGVSLLASGHLPKAWGGRLRSHMTRLSSFYRVQTSTGRISARQVTSSLASAPASSVSVRTN